MLHSTNIPFICLLIIIIASIARATQFNLSLPHQHPDPEAVVQELQRSVNASVSRRRFLIDQSPCLTGNPIDDCWRCDPNWQSNRQALADCAIGFGHEAQGGKGGPIYTVTDSSDNDPQNPQPGTLRYGATQDQPLWITFSTNMAIKLKQELMVKSFKTIDGRGADVHIIGAGCIAIRTVTNVIIHNVHVHDCVPSKGSMQSDGDGISILGSSRIWIDHCSLSRCTDGLIDVTEGSTGVTISNSYFTKHDKVMLLGHSDKFEQDAGMQVTVSFNHFGVELRERMPRCRFGYFHVVNNDYTEWGEYAVGGSASPTINSQGNRYVAPSNQNAKEVTMRMESSKDEWSKWNWRTDGDVMVNGAFFVASGDGVSPQYGKAASLEPKSAGIIDQLTMNAGVFGDNRGSMPATPGFSDGGGGVVVGPGEGGGGPGYFGLIYGSGAPPRPSVFLSLLCFFSVVLRCYQTTARIGSPFW